MPDDVFKSLPAIFTTLGIPLATSDPRQRVIGSEGMKVHGKLGKVRLSTYIDCGSAISGMASADSYDVILSVITRIQPKGTNGSEIQTTVEASAKPASFSADYSRCGTTGALENKIYEMVKASFVR